MQATTRAPATRVRRLLGEGGEHSCPSAYDAWHGLQVPPLQASALCTASPAAGYEDQRDCGCCLRVDGQAPFLLPCRIMACPYAPFCCLQGQTLPHSCCWLPATAAATLQLVLRGPTMRCGSEMLTWNRCAISTRWHKTLQRRQLPRLVGGRRQPCLLCATACRAANITKLLTAT